MVDIASLIPSYVEWWHFPIIFLAGLIGEGYGAIIGGGSIVMQSVMLFLGAPIQAVIATDNAAALGTEAGIISETYKKILKNKRTVFFMLIPSILGGIIGTYLLIKISPVIIKYLVVIAVTYLLFHTYFFKSKQKSKNKTQNYILLFGLLFIIGMYNNFIGVGEGTFAKVGLMLLLGFNFVESHGLKTAATFPIRIYSVIVTSFYGFLIYPYFLTFLVSNFIAGKYATRYIKKVPNKHIKTVLTALAVVFVFYLLFFY